MCEDPGKKCHTQRSLMNWQHPQVLTFRRSMSHTWPRSEDDLDSLGDQLFEGHDCQQQGDNGRNRGNEELGYIIGRERNGTHLTNNCKAVAEISQGL
jgi:hypothetical protein